MCNDVHGFKDGNVKVGDCWRRGHAHCNAFVLLDNEVAKFHSVIMHDKGEGFYQGMWAQVWVFFASVWVKEERR